MPTPPEVLFHRYFQTLSPVDRKKYRGKKDLDRLQQPTVQSLLVRIQEEFNEALRNEKKNVPEHVEHPPFHFDYIDSSTPNALAFRYEGYSFIGITIALIETLWDVCFQLSRSQAVATRLAVSLSPGEYDKLHVVLFRTQLNFVVSHEYTHHVHGHVARGSASVATNEILDEGETGNLERQILEADADGYAAYHVLANLIDGEYRTQAITLLNLEAEQPTVQDEALFGCFVVAIGGYLFVRPPHDLDSTIVYGFTHPPQAVRMACLMDQAIRWCGQKRPALAGWMTIDRFQTLMRSAAEATWGMNGGRDWAAQAAFLLSEEGTKYRGKLNEGIRGYIQSL